MNKRGRFIVFEGPDKSGKTTQANLLYNHFKKLGKKVIITREPGGTAVSEKIRDILLDPKNKISPMCELLLYEASRAEHISAKIKPALLDGYTVICDRFTVATMAYQGFGRSLDVKVVKKLNYIATDGIKPDITIGFRLSKNEYIKRASGERDRIESESEGFRKKVNGAYSKIFKDMKNILLIDASDDINDIHKRIVDYVSKRMR
ncbi:MAG: dTMP kinase [Elusimicrobiales bacterium]|nr:dTMP kinase [Elusimicrobiales bacterium]